eukprot:CAMPEP_0194392808 /NCGR_PEP_ID=MMETSP0174-20130528/122945_1 /TAXON_ID=216777 /ORGANISM="Proboscia alata, Strain PI-D3" /LENGTH=596 /DNA_ID=CAMNT_0039188417 /DNA_START=220 /DNA_END=2010 /DNA_ORIENTATION=-
MNNEQQLHTPEESILKKKSSGYSNENKFAPSIGRTYTEIRHVIVTISDTTSFQNRFNENNKFSSATLFDMNNEQQLHTPEESILKKKSSGYSNENRFAPSIGRTYTEIRHVIVTISDTTSFQNRFNENNKKFLSPKIESHYDAERVEFLLGVDKIRKRMEQKEASSIDEVKCDHEKSMILSQGRNSYVMAVTAFRDNDRFFESLSLNPYVKSVDEDYDMDILEGSIDRYLLDIIKEGDKNPALRNLDEMIPYGIKSVHADVVSPAPRTANPVTLCVVDTGIFRGHNDFPGEGISGDDSARAGPWDDDVNGHGTHIAGIIAAEGDNGIGTRGIIGDLSNSNINLHITRSHGAQGAGGRMSDVLAAMNQCRQKGAKVINLSVGCNECYSSSTDALFSELYEEGILVVAAAGNDGSTNKKYPASYKGVVSVGSVTYFDSLSSSTQTNDQIEFTAPGSGVYSTSIYQNRYTTKHGTSMASPHVSGVAALVWSHYPNCSAKQIRNVLAHSARYPGTSPGCDMEFGFGVPEADKALDYLAREGCEGVEIMLSGEGGCDTVQLTDSRSMSPSSSPTKYPIMTSLGLVTLPKLQCKANSKRSST